MTKKRDNAAPEESRDEWRTPPELFRLYNDEYRFGLDAAADSSNALCDLYFSENNSALDNEWNLQGIKHVWMNPPFSNPLQYQFLAKAKEQSEKHNLVIVAVIPVATETERWVQVTSKAAEIHFLYPRVNYIHPIRNERVSGVRWPSAVVIFEKSIFNMPIAKWRNWKTGEFT